MRLRKIAGLDQPEHFHRPIERAFTAEERSRVTILFGGFTWKHEDLIRAVFQGCGYRCEKLPVPDVPAFQIGKEYGNNGQCNPTYFTVGKPGAVSAVPGKGRDSPQGHSGQLRLLHRGFMRSVPLRDV